MGRGFVSSPALLSGPQNSFLEFGELESFRKISVG